MHCHVYIWPVLGVLVDRIFLDFIVILVKI